MSSLAIILISLALLSQCQADLIGDLCTKSQNPSLCNQVLRSDPRSRDGNAQTLATIALYNAASSTKGSIEVAKAASNKGRADTCVRNFVNALNALKECAPLITKGDRFSISSLQTQASAALTDVDTCSDEFGDASAKAYTFVQLLLIIVKTL